MTTPNTIFPHSTPKRRAIGNIIVGQHYIKTHRQDTKTGVSVNTKNQATAAREF
jgi:hypothetical protein